MKKPDLDLIRVLDTVIDNLRILVREGGNRDLPRAESKSLSLAVAKLLSEYSFWTEHQDPQPGVRDEVEARMEAILDLIDDFEQQSLN